MEQKNPADNRLSLSELIDIPVFQSLTDSFSNLTGIPTAILDLKGEILIASGWKKICSEFHRKNPITASRCLESDTILAAQLEKGQKFNIYKCKNGLIDAATPIMIENIHLGNLYVGQFLFEKPDMDFFQKQARECGFHRSAYFDALGEVPVRSKNQIEEALKHFINLTIAIASAGITKKKMLDLNKNLETQVHERTVKLEMEKTFSESLMNSLPGVMYVFDQFGHIKKWNKNVEAITGYSKTQIQNMSPIDFIAPEDKSRVRESITRTFQNENTTIEAGLVTLSGEIIPFLFTGFKYMYRDNNYLIGVGINISKRVKIENEKANLIQRLQESLSEVKKLSGLLPICASCKKIRDDKGYWNQIESYIHEHSEAEFSHGLCPECLEKLYGDEDWYQKSPSPGKPTPED